MLQDCTLFYLHHSAWIQAKLSLLLCKAFEGVAAPGQRKGNGARKPSPFCIRFLHILSCRRRAAFPLLLTATEPVTSELRWRPSRNKRVPWAPVSGLHDSFIWLLVEHACHKRLCSPLQSIAPPPPTPRFRPIKVCRGAFCL